MKKRGLAALAPLLLLAAAPPGPAALKVKASAVASPCVTAAGAAYEHATGRRVSVVTTALGAADSADGADLVVGAVEELTRVLESGATDLELDADVARVPWVLVGAAQSSDLSALARGGGRVLVPGGTVAREARRSLSLQGLSTARLTLLDPVRTPLRLEAGTSAIVPLSLAGRLKATSLAIAPLTLRAAGLRASGRPTDVRAFLDFLGGSAGSEAFRSCGRGDVP